MRASDDRGEDAGSADARSADAGSATAGRRAGPRRVAVLDSGVGGLTVVAEIRRLAPELGLVYLADTALFPYGGLAPEALTRRLDALLTGLRRRFDPDAAVIACNTASTAVLEPLRAAHPDLPIVGTVPPLKTAGQLSRSRTVALLATEGTARRPYVDRLIADFLPDCRVLRPPCLGLAAQAERKLRGLPVEMAVVRAVSEALSEAERAALDVVVLGCTHYPYLRAELAEVLGPSLVFLDPAAPVARRLAQVLEDAPRRLPLPGFADCALFTATPRGPGEDPAGLAPHLAELGFARWEVWNPAAAHAEA